MKFKQLITILILIVYSNLSFAQLNADFAADDAQGCAPHVIIFSNLTTGANINTTYLWDFGNGFTTTEFSPLYSYTSPGVYTVRLTAFNGATQDTEIKTAYVTVFENPRVDFSSSSLVSCLPFSVTFTDLSTSSSSTIVTRQWAFGDGNITTPLSQNNVSHTYTDARCFNVRLIVTDANGCSANLVKNNYVCGSGTSPNANFKVNDSINCSAPFNVTFTPLDQSAGNIYKWDFGDGQISSSNIITHTYTTEGEFSPKLKVTNAVGCKDSVKKDTLIKIATRNFTSRVVPASPCVGDFVTFSTVRADRRYSLLSYAWDISNGTQSNAPSVLTQFFSEGLETYQNIITYRNGCKDTLSGTVNVGNQPDIQISYTSTAGCNVPARINFRDLTVGGTAWLWDFGDGTTSTVKNPIHDFTSSGSYDITLTVQTGNCSGTKVFPAYINIGNPIANFTFNSLNYCAPSSFQFNDISTINGTVTNRRWDFGNGNIVNNVRNPIFTFTNPGTYNVELFIELSAGCKDSITIPITVGQNIVADFSANVTTICYGNPITFNSNAPLADSIRWIIEGNVYSGTSYTHNFSDAGVFTISMIAYKDGCKTIIVKSNYIRINPPKANFTLQYSCSGNNQVNFMNASSGNNNIYSWDFGDGSPINNTVNPIHAYGSPGIKIVTLTARDNSNGCVNTVVDTFSLDNPTAVINFSVDSVCPNRIQTATATGSLNAETYRWSLIDELGVESNVILGDNDNYTFRVSRPGEYSIRLIVSNSGSCLDTAEINKAFVIYGVIPNFEASPLFGCIPLLVNFRDTTSNSIYGTAVSWRWRFGELNAGSTIQNPSYTYVTEGQKTVSLSITDNHNCTTTKGKPLYINTEKLKPRFEAVDSAVCLGDTIFFNNYTFNGNNLEFEWNFGDGNTSTDSLPFHVYNSVGTYNVSLKVTENGLCDTTYIKNAYIHITSPSVDFFSSDSIGTCPPFIVSFTSINSPDIVAWEWDFGDGNFASGQNPSNIYTVPGAYDIKLIAYSSGGCVDSVIKPAMIKLLGPYGRFTPNATESCTSPLQVCFNTEIRDAESVRFFFGDNTYFENTINPNTVTNFCHTYSSVGTFKPTAILKGTNGCINVITLADSITIHSISTNFTSDIVQGCENVDVNFTSAVVSSDEITSWRWDFGDGTSSNLENPTHSYAIEGSYDVKLYITTQNGCTDSIIKDNYIVVYRRPDISFNILPNVGCVPINATFENNSIPHGNITNMTWNFDDGSLPVTNINSPSHLFTNVGNYNVSLTITNSNGCSNTLIKQYSVFPRPSANISSNDTLVCSGDYIQLNATGGLRFEWTPSIGLSCASCSNPFLDAVIDTLYTVNVFDINGCSAKDSVRIQTIQRPIGNISGDVSICRGASTQLNVNVPGATSYLWFPSTDLSCTACANPISTATATRVYYAEAFASPNVCPFIDTLTVTVNELPNGMVSNDTTICLNDSIQIFASGGSAYNWTPSAGLSNSTINNPIAKPTSNTDYIVQISNNLCSIKDTVSIKVISKIGGNISNDTTICESSPLNLFASGGKNYEWSPSNGLNATNIYNPVAILTDNSVFNVIISNGSCIPDTQSVSVIINKLPILSTSGDVTIMRGQNTQLSVSANEQSVFTWNFNNTLSCTGCRTPIASPVQTTTYTVRALDNFGCIAYADIKVNVIDDCSPEAIFVANAFTPNGDMLNDEIHVLSEVLLSVEDFSIYNRWGQLLFTSNDINIGWDGKFNGKEMPSGVYTYKVRATCINGNETIKAGNITLIR
jgi:gliding motility-associated-like protein